MVAVSGCGGGNGDRFGMSDGEFTAFCDKATYWFEVKHESRDVERTGDRDVDAIVQEEAQRAALLELIPLVIEGSHDKYDNDLPQEVNESIALYDARIALYEEIGADPNNALDFLDAFNDRYPSLSTTSDAALDGFVNNQCPPA